MCTLMGLCTNGKTPVPVVFVSPEFKAMRKVPLISLKKASSNYVIYQPSKIYVTPLKSMSKKMLKESNDIFPKGKVKMRRNGNYFIIICTYICLCNTIEMLVITS